MVRFTTLHALQERKLLPRHITYHCGMLFSLRHWAFECLEYTWHSGVTGSAGRGEASSISHFRRYHMSLKPRRSIHASLKFGATRPGSTAKLACTRPLSASGFFLPAFNFAAFSCYSIALSSQDPALSFARRDTLVHSTTRQYNQAYCLPVLPRIFRLQFAGSDKGARTSTRQQCRSLSGRTGKPTYSQTTPKTAQWLPTWHLLAALAL
jgi:hypothetical protein